MEGVNDTMIYNSVSIHHGHIACKWKGEAADTADIFDNGVPGVDSVLVRKQFGGMLKYGENQASLMLYGVDPENEQKNTIISGKITNGAYCRNA